MFEIYSYRRHALPCWLFPLVPQVNWLAYNKSNSLSSEIYQSPPNCLSPQFPLFLRVSVSLNFFKLCGMWSQFLWEKIRSYLLRSFSLQAKSLSHALMQGWTHIFLWVTSCCRSWVLSVEGDSSLRYFGLASSCMKLPPMGRVKWLGPPEFQHATPKSVSSPWLGSWCLGK